MTDHLNVFEKESKEMRSFYGMAPVRDIGRTAEEDAMSDIEYLQYRMGRIAGETSASSTS